MNVENTQSSGQPAQPEASRPSGSPKGPWQPPARQHKSSHSLQMFVAVSIALVIGAISLWFFARVASRDGQSLNFGDRQFILNGADNHAKRAKVSPLFFNDLVKDKTSLPLVLSYLGENNWAAMNAIPKGSTANCIVQWDMERKVLVNPCTKDTFAPDGVSDSGPALVRYSAIVNSKNQLVVDLRGEIE